ncbi:Anaphase-promoting complex subunit 8 [Tritrichomonas foetus]|uniref:Anaphase-promoting complex subunit 8 n=1 Tax=Tritrichomonas foetus TaxID=1144522 RepID=A0A1J4JTQ1_9EUKA|nr:Anaphase-promoting complex subunit 8 [Tritrichomonas foetus]|eukprot:OHT01816.1 Anaphase-promoting complex subunit 8 [Tritrichomonas foetus]
MEFPPIDQTELASSYSVLTERCLNQSASWLLEFMLSTDQITTLSFEPQSPNFLLAQSLFSIGEFNRVEFILKDNTDQQSLSLKFLSKLFSIQRELEQTVSTTSSFLGSLSVPDSSHFDRYSSLIKEMNALESQFDAINIYIFSAALAKGGRYKEAVQQLVTSVNLFPCNRSAWNLLLSTLVRFDNAYIDDILLVLPNHWTRLFFMVDLFAEIQKNRESLHYLQILLEKLSIPRTSSVIALQAKVYYHKRDFDHAQKLFEELRKVDPYHFETMELYSNLLFVKEDVAGLSELSQALSSIDKCRPETLTVSGNFYGINGKHDEAIYNFSSALCADSSFTFAWTLIGHEFVELENVSAAMASYSRAYESNPHDFRAIYGLGRVYEMSKMPYHAALYYRNAVIVNPNDWRMWIALGEIYDELFENDNAMVCYKKAVRLPDCDSIIYYKLGLNFYNRDEEERAAFCFDKFINNSDKPKEVKDAMMKLQQYYIHIDDKEKIEELNNRQNTYSQSFSETENSSSLM